MQMEVATLSMGTEMHASDPAKVSTVPNLGVNHLEACPKDAQLVISGAFLVWVERAWLQERLLWLQLLR